MVPILGSLRQAVSDSKVVDSKVFNLLGVQVQRTVAAHVIYSLRRGYVDERVRDTVAELDREGVALVPNFLPQDQFEAIQREHQTTLDNNPDKLVIFNHGPNRLEAGPLKNFEQTLLPNTLKFVNDPRLMAILEAAEKRPLGPLSGSRAFERLTQGPDNGTEDPETKLHSDIFFANHKAWLYLTDVGPENGPFVYVKRSHRIKPAMLYYVYKESCRQNGGSRRIAQEELQRLGLEESVITCPKNTLVVANVTGFHRRARGKPGYQRSAVNVSMRANPFTWWRYRTRTN